jgi:hypothetical protein
LIDEIVETLKSMPKARLRIVRDVVGALAGPAELGIEAAKVKRRGRKSLLKTPFCGMWEGRTDIGNGRSYATKLRQTLENRGDRSSNVRRISGGTRRAGLEDF